MKGTLSLIGLALGLFTAVMLGLSSWHIDQDIDGWKDRAEVSSEPNDMLMYMTNVKNGMEKWSMISGNSALIFSTPATDMGLIYKNIGQYISQSELLVGMDRTTPEYAMNLEQLSWSINRIEIHAYEYYANHDGLGISILCWIGWLMFFAFGLWWLFTDSIGQ